MKQLTALIFLFVLGIADSAFAQGGWQKISNPISGRLVAIDFVSENEGYVLGETELYFTSDGGLNWLKKKLPDFGGMGDRIHFSSVSTGVLSYYYKDIISGIFFTSNGGETWSEKVIPNLTSNDWYHGFSFMNPAEGYIMGVTSSGYNPIIAHTADSGFTWEAWHFQLPDGGPNYVITEILSFRTPSVGMASFLYFFPAFYSVMVTEDSGRHWVDRNAGLRGGTKIVTYLSNGEWLCSSYCGDYCKGPDSTFFYKSTNDGLEWKELFSLPVSISSNSNSLEFNGKTGFLSFGRTYTTYPGIMGTSDFGNHWQVDSSPDIGSINGFSVPSSEVAYAFSYTAILKTTTGGRSKVNSGIPQIGITLLSNPISTSADFQFDLLNSSTSFELFDLLGKAIYHEQLSAGQASFHLDIQKYPSGIYFARLGNETVRFVKE